MKQVINIIIVIIISFIYIINATDPIVNLIVDPNGNSVYTVGDYCGNTTLTCNSILDAVAYFHTIENNQAPTSSGDWIYQQLNLQLTDGTYGVSGSSLNAFEFNLTISPLTVGSTKVIFDGTKDVTANPLISVISPAGIDDSTRLTHITITGISFNSFSQPILSISTNSANTFVTFITCNLDTFNGSVTNSPLINSNGDSDTVPASVGIFPSYINFTDCNIRFSTMNADTSLIIGTQTAFIFNSAFIVSSVNVKSAVSVSYGFVTITGSSFSSISSSYSVFNLYNTLIDAYYSAFNNNNVSTNGAVLTYTATTTGDYMYRFSNCSLSQNIATLNGGVIYSVNTATATENQDSQIVNSTLNGNYAGVNGGAVYSDNVPVLFLSSSLSQNSAPNSGGTFYVTNVNSLRADQSTISQSTTLQSTNGGLMYSYASSVKVMYSVFNNINPTGAIVCNASTMTFLDNDNLADSFVCVNCDQQYSNVCQATTTAATTTTTTTTSSSTSGHHGDGSFATINYQISNLLLLISFTISLIFVL